MSNLIPPLLSSTPPPIVDLLEEDDDEFGDFRAASDLYDCYDSSLPPTPEKSPKTETKSDASKTDLDVNSNNNQKVEMPMESCNDKDFHDRRKTFDIQCSEIQVNCRDNSSVDNIFSIELPGQTIKEQDYKDVLDLERELPEPELDHIFETQQNCEFDENLSTAGNNEILFENQGCFQRVPKAKDEESTKSLDHESNTKITERVENSEEISDNSEDEQSLSIDTLPENDSENDKLDTEDKETKAETTLNNEHEETCEITIAETLLDDEHEETSEMTKAETLLDDEREETCEITKAETPLYNEYEEKSEIAKAETPFSEDTVEIPAENQTNFEGTKNMEPITSQSEDIEDEFGDFENHFTEVVKNDVPQSHTETEDEFGDFESSNFSQNDEFGDFNAFSTQPMESSQPVMLTLETKDVLSKAESVLKEMFPQIDLESEEYCSLDDIKENIVFKGIQDITDTNALLYQWSKSDSQKQFLKALNIDMRNILYGPAWNNSMPKFAGNLSSAPLEPTRTKILTPSTVQNTSSPSISSQKNCSSDIPSAQFDWNSSGLINPLDSGANEPFSGEIQQKTDFFLPKPPDKSLFTFDGEIQEKTSQDSDTISTGSFELPKPERDYETGDKSPIYDTPFDSPKLIPLRESHIANEPNDLSWSLTPELSRRSVSIEQEDAEFDDFQMVLPEGNKTESKNQGSILISPDLSEFDVLTKNLNSAHNMHIFTQPENLQQTIASINPLQDLKETQKEDEEFGGFQSSVIPVAANVITLHPVPVEPLRPSVSWSVAPAAQINWPEPGVTDEEIRRIELSYSRKEEKSDFLVKEVKKTTDDDDDWTDFVSVTNPLKSVFPERTATPDLPLSVLNLGQVQPRKQPTPLITHNGLIQKRISPNPGNVVQTTIQPASILKPATIRPSTISDQFAKNVFQSNTNDDDDDWSDFVSSQPLPQTQNGFQKGPPKPQVNWTNANIITNPHFDSLPQSSKMPNIVQQRSTISSISAIPDLDFIAPKNRTSRK